MQDCRDMIATLIKYVNKIHHTDGRLRLRVNSGIKDEIKDLNFSNLKQTIYNISGISEIKFNQMVGSLTIFYDNTKINMQDWEKLLLLSNKDDIKYELSKYIRE